MKLSIAVPSLNNGQHLASCLESIRLQTHGDFEVLIADGGSRDESLAIIAGFVERDARFRLVSTSDAGQADGVNKALLAAAGDIHCYLNADDQFLCNDVFQAVVAAFESYFAISLVSFGGWSIDANSRPVRNIRLRYHPRDNFQWMRRRTAVLQPATFWRAAVTRRFSFHPELRYTFDSWFFYEAYREFGWIELSKPVAGARLHVEHASEQIRAAQIREFARFERFKYGDGSWRARYLSALGGMVSVANAIPLAGPLLCRAIYLAANSSAYLSFYTLPTIVRTHDVDTTTAGQSGRS